MLLVEMRETNKKEKRSGTDTVIKEGKDNNDERRNQIYCVSPNSGNFYSKVFE